MNSMLGSPAGKFRKAGEKLSPFSREKESPNKGNSTQNSQSNQPSKYVEHGDSLNNLHNSSISEHPNQAKNFSTNAPEGHNSKIGGRAGRIGGGVLAMAGIADVIATGNGK